MAIRIRYIHGQCIALCAARSTPKDGDIYLDDEIHAALANKFARDFSDEDIVFSGLYDDSELVEKEESNNENRRTWDEWMAACPQ